MYETHEQCAQLLTVEGVLLLCNVHLNLPGGNVIQQHSYQLEEEPGTRRNLLSLRRKTQIYPFIHPPRTKWQHCSIFLSKHVLKTICFTNLAKVSSGRAFCASPLGSWLPTMSAVGGSFEEGLCRCRRRIVWQERRCGERESSWTRDRTISSVDWETSTLSTARIPDTHSWTVATDAWRSTSWMSSQEIYILQ